jgi:hypothetical protein
MPSSHSVRTTRRGVARLGVLARVLCVLAISSRAYPQVCGDVDRSGAVTASDALSVLAKAVGQDVLLQCIPLARCPGVSRDPAVTVIEPVEVASLPMGLNSVAITEDHRSAVYGTHGTISRFDLVSFVSDPPLQLSDEILGVRGVNSEGSLAAVHTSAGMQLIDLDTGAPTLVGNDGIANYYAGAEFIDDSLYVDSVVPSAVDGVPLGGSMPVTIPLRTRGLRIAYATRLSSVPEGSELLVEDASNTTLFVIDTLQKRTVRSLALGGPAEKVLARTAGQAVAVGRGWYQPISRSGSSAFVSPIETKQLDYLDDADLSSDGEYLVVVRRAHTVCENSPGYDEVALFQPEITVIRLSDGDVIARGIVEDDPASWLALYRVIVRPDRDVVLASNSGNVYRLTGLVPPLASPANLRKGKLGIAVAK